MAEGALLQADHLACGRCRRPMRLLAVVGPYLLCSACWEAAGSPWPRGQATAQEIHEAELAIRERMTARGGTDKHLVRKGLS